MLDLLSRAEREATRERRTATELEDLLNALSQELRGPLGELLAAFRIAPGSLRPHMRALRTSPRASPDSDEAPSFDALEPFDGDPTFAEQTGLVGRAVELRRLLGVLERQAKCHALLVGEPGVGKRAIVLALSRRIAQGDVPTSLAGARLFSLRPAGLTLGSRLRGEVEERAKKLLLRLVSGRESAILVVPSLDQLFVSGSALSGLPDLLRVFIERNQLRVLGTTTPEGLRKIQERDPHFVRQFTELEVTEPSVDEAVEILRAASARLEAHHRVGISEAALSASVRLARRYLQDRHLPESAIDLLDEAAAQKRVAVDGLGESADAELSRLESLEAQLLSTRDPRDPDALPVRQRLEAEQATLLPRVQAIREQIEARRSAVASVRTLSAEQDEIEKAIETARTAPDPARLRELEDRELPGLLERLEAAEQKARALGAKTELDVVGAEDVAATLSARTGIPESRMLEGEAAKLLEMEQRLGQRVVGQEAALSAVSRAVRRGRVGLRDPRRPIGSFLFLGPSGVGKTELAKALAELLFDDERALTRLDMSEFMERHMAQRLIGSPPGYADSEQGGFLTEAVRRRPYSVLLFDEVEKAHQDVFNLLLQLLDEGRLTDGRGRTADFSNTVVILTSNIGSDRILDAEPRLFDSDEGREALRDVLLERLREFFRPELLNRIDEVQVFRPLGKEQLRKVVELELTKLGSLLSGQGLSLSATPAAKDHLVDLGYEPALGARPLRRVILRHVQDPLAEGLLSGRFVDHRSILVDLGEGAIVLKPE
jgi:ATP-dependent Clp protease ATP-binding subunit ClpB